MPFMCPQCRRAMAHHGTKQTRSLWTVALWTLGAPFVLIPGFPTVVGVVLILAGFGVHFSTVRRLAVYQCPDCRYREVDE